MGKKTGQKELDEYMQSRADKLRELYETCQEQFEIELVKVYRDGNDRRQFTYQETYIGNPVSPFDLPDFHDIMPKVEDRKRKLRVKAGK